MYIVRWVSWPTFKWKLLIKAPMWRRASQKVQRVYGELHWQRICQKGDWRRGRQWNGKTCLLSEAWFRLTKKMRNRREVLSEIPDGERARPRLDLDFENLPVESKLGVQWDVEKDAFLFKVYVPHQQSTKHGILSAVSLLYYQMGFVCPVVLESKKFCRSCGLGWNDEILEDLQNHHHKFRYQDDSWLMVKCVTYLFIYSQMYPKKAMACVPIWIVYASRTVWCSIFIGRSRHSPVRPISIPRLELQAATSSVNIYRMPKDELTYEIGKVTFWSDCQMTLQYIKNETKHVANHVAEMCEVTLPDHCRPCPGKVNPADDASWGLSHQKLCNVHR